MELKEKERTLIQDLQTQEQSCVEKYGKYAAQAKDPELKSLFETIQKEEQKHYDTLQQVLDGSVPACDCNDTQGKDYEPKVTYGTFDNSEDKKHDAFLATLFRRMEQGGLLDHYNSTASERIYRHIR